MRGCHAPGNRCRRDLTVIGSGLFARAGVDCRQASTRGSHRSFNVRYRYPTRGTATGYAAKVQLHFASESQGVRRGQY
ncbi:hypothetical protein D3C78_1558140 [compost metagenome]